MRATRDTFLHFLSDNLTGLTVRNVRKATNNPSLAKLADNAVNVQFLTPRPHPHIASQLVSIDVIHEDELTAVDMTQQVYELLSSAYYTPKYDYTDPDNPVLTGQNIMWSRELP